MQKTTRTIMTIWTVIILSVSPLFATISRAQSDGDPESVNIPGTHQDELGCSGEW